MILKVQCLNKPLDALKEPTPNPDDGILQARRRGKQEHERHLNKPRRGPIQADSEDYDF